MTARRQVTPTTEGSRRVLDSLPGGSYSYEELWRLCGVKGDGITDDTDSLQAWLDLGMVIDSLYHKGAYVITGPLAVPKRAT